MLKMVASPERLTLEEVSDSEGGDGIGGIKIAKKSGKISESRKLSKSRKSKGKKSKKPSKSGNLPNFDARNSGPNFLTPKARLAFNRLWLAFTEARILWHFDPECHIRIKTDISG